MAEVILITGGCRSGKSNFAKKYCEQLNGTKLFLATAPLVNDQMKARVEKHKSQRDPSIWQTVEEQFSLADIFTSSKHDVILIDCVSFWIDNLIYKSPGMKEEDLIPFIEKTIFTLDKFNGTAVFVTNEVGMGLIPEDNRSRKYRDLVGAANAIIAAKASGVTFLVSGIPLMIKG